LRETVGGQTGDVAERGGAQGSGESGTLLNKPLPALLE
jgi:hypothetical protein